MTDLPPTPPTPPLTAAPVTPKAPRGLKIVLALSLALNLAVVGTVAGVALRGRMSDGPGPMAVRDLSFGPFSDALTRDQRRDMLRGFAERGPSLREMRDDMRRDFDGILTSLRTSPFDPEAFRAAVVAQGSRIQGRAETGRDALVSLILGMSDNERAEFAERLERAVNRKGGKPDFHDRPEPPPED